MTVGEDDEVVVTIEDVADPAAAAAGKEDPAASLKQQFTELQTQTERERTRAVEAEGRAAAATREAEAARKEAQTARVEIVDTQFATVTSGLEAAESEAKAAEQEYTSAFERGDGPAMAAAQRKMARAETRIQRLEESKADLEARKKAAPAEERREPARPASADPVEAYIAGRTEPTAKWLREHREWISDPRKNAKLTAAHYSAQGEGIAADTPEYFEHVESFLGLRDNGAAKKGADDPKPNGAKTPAARRQSVPHAPVTASGGGVSGGGQEVRLSQGEAKSATDGTLIWNYDDPSGQKRFKKGDPIGVQEMARRKLQQTKDGLHDRGFTTS